MFPRVVSSHRHCSQPCACAQLNPFQSFRGSFPQTSPLGIYSRAYTVGITFSRRTWYSLCSSDLWESVLQTVATFVFLDSQLYLFSSVNSPGSSWVFPLHWILCQGSEWRQTHPTCLSSLLNVSDLNSLQYFNFYNWTNQVSCTSWPKYQGHVTI